MLLALKLAYRNLLGAGLRTWLNVIVLSFSFIVIIWIKGVMVGWDYQAKTDMTNWEIADGQYWQKNYDLYDPFSLSESHAKIPAYFQTDINTGNMVPILITQGTIYSQGRMHNIIVKGIPAHQKLFLLPTHKLDTNISLIPAIIGVGMSKSNQLKVGDVITLQWRDAKGTFDAAEIQIVDIFASNVPNVDQGQIWIDIRHLQNMLMLPNHATTISFKENNTERQNVDGWVLKTKKELTSSIDEMIKMKSGGQSVFYIILLILSMLAIFDTQVLSIFRRQKEIGTYIALGYTKKQVVTLFTVEGAMHAVLAAVFSAIYGIPFLLWQAKVGWTLPVDASEYGMAMAQTLYPIYSFKLILSTTVLVMFITTIVSYWPARKISKMKPTDALRGKIQ